jgi:hypothetical protein
MVDDRPEDTPPSPDAGRPKRAPPTIDLEASEVSGETRSAAADAQPEPSSPGRSRAAISSAVISAVCGAVAAALVIAAVWFSGWPETPAPSASSPPAPQASAPEIDALASRVAAIEANTARPPVSAPDPALASRIAALEKSEASLRAEIGGLRKQSEQLAAGVNDVKSATRENSREDSPAPDLSAISDRIAQLERATRAQGSELAQSNAKAADDTPLRRLVAASLLDVLVRTGDPYTAALAAAKSLAPSPDDLKPLDDFAASGVPKAAKLSRELLALVPKLQPASQENSTTGAGIVDRLEAGAKKLVRIERTDTSGSDRGNVIARVTAAALRNDVAEARRELNTLAPADRAAAQSWIDKANARDAALAASRQFAAEAMTALAEPRQ